MGCRRTDCVERPLSRLFEKLGRLVGSYPIGFFIIPLVVSLILGGGFYFLEKRMDNDIEVQFTPRNGPSKKAREFVQEHFPRKKSEFSSQRLDSEGHYATIMAVAKGKDIMTKEAFEDIIQLDSKVKSISVQNGQNKLTFDTLCAKTNGGCVPNDLLGIIDYNASKIPHMDIAYPVHISPATSKHTFLGSTIGGVRRKENGLIKFANAVKFVYFLENKEGVEKWLQQFQNNISNDHEYKHVMVCEMYLRNNRYHR